MEKVLKGYGAKFSVDLHGILFDVDNDAELLGEVILELGRLDNDEGIQGALNRLVNG